MGAFHVSILKSIVSVEILSCKAATERKFQAVPTPFYVNRILNGERTRTLGNKKKHCKKEKNKHAFSLSIGNSHTAANLTHLFELSLMGLSCF